MEAPALRLAVVGAGVIGRRHVELIAQSPRCRLVALVDPTPAAASYAAALGVPLWDSLEALFAQGGAAPDGVILATPNPLHVPGALLCLAQGVPALIEKPVADSLAAGLRLAAALEGQAVPMLVGQHRRHSGILRGARAAIASGRLGRLVTVSGSAQFHKPDSYFEQGPWRSRAGGGPILINLIHEIDNLRYLCGEIESVQAIASNAVRGFEVEDSALVLLKFASGALGSLTLSDTVAAPRSWEQTSGENLAYARYPSEDCYFLAGTEGSLALPTMRLWRTDTQGGEAGWFTALREETLAADRSDPLAAQLAHFCDLLQGRAAPIITVADALQSLRAVEAVRLAIEQGRTVALTELV